MVKLFCSALLLTLTSLPMATPKSDSTETGSSYSEVTSKRYSNYIGIAGGMTSGYGLSYKRWFDKWAIQLTLFPWYEEEKYSAHRDNDDYNYYGRDSGYYNNGNGSVGLMCIRSLLESKYIRFCAYGGGNCDLEYEKYNYYRDEYKNSGEVTVHYTGKKLTNDVSLGVGCGAEFFVWRFGFHGMAGVRGAYRFPDKAKTLGISVDGGVYFRF